MKILIYGAGVQGQFLAHALNTKDNDITMFARGKTLEHLNQKGLKLQHSLQRKTTNEHITTISTLSEHDIYDVIFVTMKYSDFYNVVPTLAQNKSENIIFIGNNMNPKLLQSTLTQQSNHLKHITFGFLMTGGSREASHINILRFNAGELKVGNMHGEITFSDKLNSIFKNAKIKLTYEQNFEDWLMSHAALVLPLNMLFILKQNQNTNAQTLTKETIAAFTELHQLLEHKGHTIKPKAQSIIFKNFKGLSNIVLKTVMNIGLINQTQGSFKELEALYNDVKVLNQNTALTTSHLDALFEASKSVS
ncbi:MULTISPECIES: ketopantoate reductase family protein [Staphylococcus]|uniref:ketopantoate reductase family protein n=1 Tax=Staphylococcus TaxID=1279 RepID=UPI000852A837|nr:2-dehydropantoate 2-reductase N-terminal domain-containing protein [Staphylococcus equorum]MDK9846807.1 2-dehydropantoate 2-reductase N-terminal domain-containing protein [Staphylococcus equorum]MDK9847857.1 2-dehydropantoate 2-reductase N-terminal domain-containing protein [Staphylococcus equorum]MDK9854855.1 2-dehydropantoate 2-reductase N-terminal domain-containing protein [Staphylococcus equorum]OEK51674.1 ACP synthase [Staphylococcus equorum]